jgi:hypothetical protein
MNPEKFNFKIELEGNPEQEKMPVLSEPIENVDYFKEGDVSAENEKLRVDFNYSFADYRDYALGPDEVDGLLGNYPMSNGYRKLNSFILTDKIANRQIDLLDKLPEGYIVLFNPFSGMDNGGASVEDKGCVVMGDISSIRGILITIHEIGHCVDYEKSADKDKWCKTQMRNAETEEEIMFSFQKEWAAWRFAINKIRPFLRSGALPKEEIFKDIHSEGSLASYCRTAEVTLEGIEMMKIVKEEIKKIKKMRMDEFNQKLHELMGL